MEEQQQPQQQPDDVAGGVVWDERVRKRVAPDEQYLYDMPFFAEIFNALHRHFTGQTRAWRLSDFCTASDVRRVYGTTAKCRLRQHFLRAKHCVPFTDSGMRRVTSMDEIGYLRVQLDDDKFYPLHRITELINRTDIACRQVIALTPFVLCIKSEEEEEEGSERVFTSLVEQGYMMDGSVLDDDEKEEDECVDENAVLWF